MERHIRARLLLAAVVLVLWPRPAATQWTIDLASATEQQYDVPAGTEARVTIVNRTLNGAYHVSAVVRAIEIPPIRPIPPLTTYGLDKTYPCELMKTADALAAATDEGQVRLLVLQVAAALPTAKCGSRDEARIRAILGGTVHQLPQTWVIRAGEELVITVRRLEGDGTVEKSWKLTLTTGAPGSWRTLYGVAIVPDRDDEPFLTPGANDGEFVVNAGLSRNRDLQPLKVTPAVFFTWASRSAELGPLSLSPTLGLGASGDLPGVFGGVAVTFRQNLGIVLGLPIVAQRHTRERYLADPNVQSVLTTDELTVTRYHVDKWFISGVFRFSGSPFVERKPAQEKPAGPPAALSNRR